MAGRVIGGRSGGGLVSIGRGGVQCSLTRLKLGEPLLGLCETLQGASLGLAGLRQLCKKFVVLHLLAILPLLFVFSLLDFSTLFGGFLRCFGWCRTGKRSAWNLLTCLKHITKALTMVEQFG